MSSVIQRIYAVWCCTCRKAAAVASSPGSRCAALAGQQTRPPLCSPDSPAGDAPLDAQHAINMIAYVRMMGSKASACSVGSCVDTSTRIRNTTLAVSNACIKRNLSALHGMLPVQARQRAASSIKHPTQYKGRHAGAT
jgi:hypothetical protein